MLIDANDQPRITDFGLARRLDGDSSLTMTGQVLGSPNFMPPEQAGAKRGKVGRPSDVYALGGILYYLLTARAPFQAESLEHLITQVLHAEPVAPRLLNPSIPRDLETITLKCLEKEPSRRYQTAQELADELGRFLRHEPIRARPITPPEKLWRWCRRKPALATALGFALAALVVGLATTSWQWRRAEHCESSAWRTRQRQFYVANMNLVQAAWEQNHVSRAKQLLEKLRQLRSGVRVVLLAAANASGVEDASRTHRADSGRGLFSGWPADRHRECGPYREGVGCGHRQGTAHPPRARLVRSGPSRFSPDGQRIVTGSWDRTASVWDATSGRKCAHSGRASKRDFLCGFLTERPADCHWQPGSDGQDMGCQRPATNLLTFCQHAMASGRWRFRRTASASSAAVGTRPPECGTRPTARNCAHLLGKAMPYFRWLFLPMARRIVTGSKDHGQGVGCDQAPFCRPSTGTSDRIFGRLFAGRPEDYHWERRSDGARVGCGHGEELRVLKGHGSRIGSVAFSPDGQQIITGGGAVRFSPDGRDVDFTVENDRRPRCGTPAAEGDVDAGGAHGVVCRWPFPRRQTDRERQYGWGGQRLGRCSGREIASVGGHGAAIRSVAFFPDGRRMVTGSFDHTATVWEIASGKELHT